MAIVAMAMVWGRGAILTPHCQIVKTVKTVKTVRTVRLSSSLTTHCGSLWNSAMVEDTGVGREENLIFGIMEHTEHGSA